MSVEQGRRAARQAAVFLLYQHDLTGLPLEALEENAARDSGRELDEFARGLVDGVLAARADLDATITDAAEGWTAERLAPLERNILRVAVHELRARQDIPPAVSINEAVALAKRYCQTEAAGFVNGILGRIAGELAAGRPSGG